MKWLLAMAILLVGFIIGASLYLQPNSFYGCGEKPAANTTCDKADAVVVVSGGDTYSRTAAGVDLFKRGWADYIVFSGAAYDKTGPSNAAEMMRQAEAAGVPSDVILIDEESVNTRQNADYSRQILNQYNLSDIILVTSGYHQRRASLEFNKLADLYTVRDYPIHDKDWGWFWWLTPRGWWLTGGELAKIIGFYLGAKA